MKRTFLILLFITFILLGTSVYAATFTGRVIDADTKEPIEGAVVVAYWMKARATIAGEDTELKDVKEILTDKNGEWEIKGPEGSRPSNMKALFTFITGTYYTRTPQFIIYKPGYWPYPKKTGFIAYPYIGRQRWMERTAEGMKVMEEDLEGIVLIRYGRTKEEVEEYLREQKKHAYGSVPFVPVKSPYEKLRHLDFSFEYPQTVRWISEYRGRRAFRVYTVVGLRKAKTREDRLRASRIGPIYSYDEREKELLEKQKEFIRLLEQEDKYLWPTKDNTGEKNEK